MLNDLYFKTTCNIRPHFPVPMGGLKIEGPLYNLNVLCNNVSSSSTLNSSLVKSNKMPASKGYVWSTKMP